MVSNRCFSPQHEPAAKVGTMIVMVPILFVYNKLIQTLNCPRTLVTIVSMAYAACFALTAFALNIPGIGLDNTEPSQDRWLGWVVYWYGGVRVDSFQ
jgi:hypothetical protein